MARSCNKCLWPYRACRPTMDGRSRRPSVVQYRTVRASGAADTRASGAAPRSPARESAAATSADSSGSENEISASGSIVTAYVARCCNAVKYDLQNRQLRLAPCRKRLLDGLDLFRGQVQTIGPGVVLHVIAARRFGDGERPWQPGEERQRHLPRRLVVRAGDLRQHLPALG